VDGSCIEQYLTRSIIEKREREREIDSERTPNWERRYQTILRNTIALKRGILTDKAERGRSELHSRGL
jgi:hypothetical protein